MEIKNCKKCNRIFQYLTGAQLCQACKDIEEDEFQKIKQYLKENPKASMTEVSETLDISIEKITKFLRDGRLEVSVDSAIKLECEGCGKSIITGRYCQNCAGRIEGDLRGASRDLQRRSVEMPNHVMKYLKKD